jgi:hypothetical protein
MVLQACFPSQKKNSRLKAEVEHELQGRSLGKHLKGWKDCFVTSISHKLVLMLTKMMSI